MKIFGKYLLLLLILLSLVPAASGDGEIVFLDSVSVTFPETAGSVIDSSVPEITNNTGIVELFVLDDSRENEISIGPLVPGQEYTLTIIVAAGPEEDYSTYYFFDRNLTAVTVNGNPAEFVNEGDCIVISYTFTAKEAADEPTTTPADTYYTYKGDYTRAGAINGRGPTGPDVLWDVVMPYNGTMATFFDGSPVVVGDYVYTSSWNGGMGRGLTIALFCFNKTTGEEIWRNTAVTSRAGMTAYGDYLYADDGNSVSCLNRADGTLVWKTPGISTQA